jgi:hypothetical protein
MKFFDLSSNLGEFETDSKMYWRFESGAWRQSIDEKTKWKIS